MRVCMQPLCSVRGTACTAGSCRATDTPCKQADLQVEDQQQGELQAQRAHGGTRGGPEAVQQVGQALRQPGALAPAAPVPQVFTLSQRILRCKAKNRTRQ
jgi:hypothetical protein